MKTKKKLKIAFIGSGNMAEAIIKGLLANGIVYSNNIYASDIDIKKLSKIKRKYRINAQKTNNKAVSKADIVIFATKPQDTGKALNSIDASNLGHKLLISIAAGIKTDFFTKKRKNIKIIRAMPNTPALIGSGITAVCASKAVKAADVNTAKEIFNAVGETVLVKEALMDAVTAVSGSGPAYFFLFMQSLIKSATEMGLGAELSKKLVFATAKGAVNLALKSGRDLESMIAMVASKGGTTQAALKIFKKHNFQATIIKASKHARQRSKELSKKI